MDLTKAIGTVRNYCAEAVKRRQACPPGSVSWKQALCYETGLLNVLECLWEAKKHIHQVKDLETSQARQQMIAAMPGNYEQEVK